MLRNYIKPTVLLAVSVTIIFLCLGLLADLDYILVNYITPPTYSQYENIKSRYAKDVAPFSRSADMTVYTEYRNIRNTTIYSCDEQFKDFMGLEMVSGSFLENDNVRDISSYAVIDENIAVLLFSNTDCIGRSIFMQEKELEVIGVVGAKDGVFATLTAVDRYSVYVPYANMAFPNSLGGSIYRADNPIMINTIAGLEPFTFGYVQSIANISLRAKTVAMIGRLALFAMWVIALIFVLRVGWAYLKRFYKNIKTKLSTQYLIEYLREHWPFLALHLVVVASTTTLLVIGYHLVSFVPEADPALVPAELFDHRSWPEAIAEYALAANTIVSIPFRSSILIDKIKLVLLVAGFTSVLSTTRLLRLARSKTGDGSLSYAKSKDQ